MCLPRTPPPLPTYIDSTVVFWIALQLLLAIFAFAGRFCASPIKSICESRAALMHARAFINRRPRPQRPPVLLSRIYTQHTQCTALTHTYTHLGAKKIASAAYANVWKKANVVLSEYEIIVYNCKLFNTLKREQIMLWSVSQLVQENREGVIIALKVRKVTNRMSVLLVK